MDSTLVRTRRVLVVEDDTALRTAYRTILKGAGYHVSAVTDGLAALQQLDLHALPNAVLLDLALPRLSGHDVADEIRSRPRTRHIPIVVVTGTDITVKDVDAECLLRKPVAAESLIHAIEACIRLRRR